MSLAVILSYIMGGWLLFDGMHRLLRGRYFGPDKPGPWSLVLKAVGINPNAMGGIFVGLGLLWIVAATALLLDGGSASIVACIAALLTLWYLPFGTIISLTLLGVLSFG